MTIKTISLSVAGAFVLLIAFLTYYTVPEGHVGVVTKFGKAVAQVEPGLHFKMPFIQGVRRIEVRERRSSEDLAAATGNQLPIQAAVSINWTVDSVSALDLFIRYGSLDQFEQRILDPKLRQSAKAALSKFNADELIRNRNEAVAVIQANMVELMAPYPVQVNSPQIENISFPETYMQAVLAKEEAREEAAREEYKLQQQRLQAQQEVQSAEARRDAEKARADGRAYAVETEARAEAEAIVLKGTAEAEAVRLVQAAISQNPLLVQYEQAKRWDGQLPATVLGDETPMLFSLRP